MLVGFTTTVFKKIITIFLYSSEWNLNISRCYASLSGSYDVIINN